jgi:DNA-binding response OmpR family regulator
VLLDAALPDGDGVKLCSELRNTRPNADVPVIMVTAKVQLEEKMHAFNAGADDYVTKPFEPLELRARVEAQLTRRRKALATSGTLVRGLLRLCTEEHKAYREEGQESDELKLTPMEFRLLLFLVKNEHRVVSRAEILTAVWGKSVFVVDRVIDKHVSSLRQKMGGLADYIATVPRLGYQFALKASQAS